jgi:hypothetical protein
VSEDRLLAVSGPSWSGSCYRKIWRSIQMTRRTTPAKRQMGSAHSGGCQVWAGFMQSFAQHRAVSSAFAV